MTSSQFDTLMREIGDFRKSVADSFSSVDERLRSLEQTRARDEGRKEQTAEGSESFSRKLGLLYGAIGALSGLLGSLIVPHR
jgi:hypothetical protein